MSARSSAPGPRGSWTFDEYTEELERAARAVSGVLGIVAVGSTSAGAASRRDEWSDHDFYALLAPGEESELRRGLPFLPAPERIVMVTREGAEGFAVLYDDGHLFEFGAGTPAEFATAKINHHQVLGSGREVEEWTAAAAERGRSYAPESAEEAVELGLVKLLIGFGRATRGEVLSGGLFVRGYAVPYLASAVRQRRPSASGMPDSFDPVRRFEQDHPDIAARFAAALDRPVAEAARELVSIVRSELEPDWADFPSTAADIIQRRMC